MKNQTLDISSQDGFVLVYLAVTMTVLLLFTGLAVDTGRAYAVKAQLTKAVDGAALGAARNINSGDPRGTAVHIFKANFPQGYFGTSSVTDPTSSANFYTSAIDATTGVNTVTISATATLPTTFMKLANFNQVNVGATAAATRRMVDLSLVVDVSSSIGSKWPTVRDAARNFINSFDAANDRLSLLTFSNGAKVLDQMPSTRGFAKATVMSDVPETLPGGSTLMVEGLYRGWDELRTVPNGSQSSLRIIVLFTDGASNGVPGDYENNGIAKSLRSWDFPKNAIDPDSQTWDSPRIDGLYDTETGTTGPGYSLTTAWNSNVTHTGAAQYLPVETWHSHSRSAGIPIHFPLEDSSLKVNGLPQTSRRGLRNFNIPATTPPRFPAEVWNINNAARNVLEIIGNAARNDLGGDYKIRIYTIGMSYLVRDSLGTMPEMPEDILKRISNDISSPDFNSAQLEGKYFYAPTAADVGPAFQGIQNLILRLSK